MASVTIPLRSDLDDYSVRVTLAGEDFGLRIRWNTRDSRWYLDVRDADGVTLAAGIAVVVDWPLLAKLPDTDLPEGYIVAVDTSGQAKEIEDKEDLGDRVKLVFTPRGDV